MSDPAPPGAVLWDLDGTLVDSTDDLAAAGAVARAALDLPPLDAATVAGYVGDGLGVLLERLCPDADADGLAAARAAFVAHYRDHCTDRTTVYDGVPEVLAAIHAAGVPQAVVSNKPQAFTEAILAHFRLDRYLTAVVGGDGPCKPAPDQLLWALDRCRVAPATAWMIGDHHTDLRGGRAAGCRVAWVSWGIGRRDEDPIDAVIASPDAVVSALAIAG